MAASEVDVVIVGAGSAGLSAAKAAAERGLSFHLLEASHRIGGRAYTEELAPGMPFDLGCHWMHSASLNPFVAIADRFGFHYRKDGAWRTNIYAGDGWATAEMREELFALREANDAAITAAVARGDDVAVADVVDLENRWAPFIAYWFTLGTSRDIDQVSIIDSVAYNDTEENWPLREGYGSLVALWAAGNPVTLNAPVERVRWGKGGVAVESAKGTVKGRRLLMTVSTNMLASGRIAFDPPLPAWKREAAAQLPLGVHNRIGIMLTHDPFGPDAPPSATIMAEGDEAPMSVQLRPFGFDYVVGVTGGRFGSWLERAGAAASVDNLTERLVKVFGGGIRKALSPRTIVTAWEGDPWTLGSYSAATPGNGHQRKELARPVDDILFFAGEATSPDFFATCHGAYLSGIAAIESIARSVRAAA
ncbi:MAG TPA: NAD(P)/FAD-dependent oxidoreductase [Dongiaceae bacterium]|nr:NAD(P)/FAD-dependent oxidoreductase [Dongiaceae bacterium]